MRELAFAVGVTAELQPAIELAVVGEQHATAAKVDQPGRSGEVPGQAFAPERVLGIAQQVGEQCDGFGFVGPASAIVGQQRGLGGVAGFG